MFRRLILLLLVSIATFALRSQMNPNIVVATPRADCYCCDCAQAVDEGVTTCWDWVNWWVDFCREHWEQRGFSSSGACEEWGRDIAYPDCENWIENNTEDPCKWYEWCFDGCTPCIEWRK